MKDFQRNDLMFSLCGLNCALCSMKLDNYCPGCGGGAGNQGCAIARCSLQHGKIDYCYQCNKYPCEKYKGIEAFDSFITHRNQLKDMEKAKRLGVELYQTELSEKAAILKHLIQHYNDGRKKSFFCLAVNLLDLEDVKTIVQQIAEQTTDTDLNIKERAAIASALFQSVAGQRQILLKLNKKPKQSF